INRGYLVTNDRHTLPRGLFRQVMHLREQPAITVTRIHIKGCKKRRIRVELPRRYVIPPQHLPELETIVRGMAGEWVYGDMFTATHILFSVPRMDVEIVCRSLSDFVEEHMVKAKRR